MKQVPPSVMILLANEGLSLPLDVDEVMKVLIAKRAELQQVQAKYYAARRVLIDLGYEIQNDKWIK